MMQGFFRNFSPFNILFLDLYSIRKYILLDIDPLSNWVDLQVTQ